MIDWSGSTSIVTGGASGLGNAAARAFAALGMKVVIFDVNDALGEPEATDIGGHYYHVDVSDPASISQALDRVEADVGIPRAIVNCAGIAPAAKTVSRGLAHDAEVFAKAININLMGSFYCASQVAARMVAADTLDGLSLIHI